MGFEVILFSYLYSSVLVSTYTYIYTHTHMHLFICMRMCNLHIKVCIGLSMAPHSSTLAWKIPWTAEPGSLQSTGPLRVGHDWATSLSLFTFMHWRRKWQPTPVFLPGESQEWGAWWAAVYGVAQSRTRLKLLRSSSSSYIQIHIHVCTYLCIYNTKHSLF